MASFAFPKRIKKKFNELTDILFTSAEIMQKHSKLQAVSFFTGNIRKTSISFLIVAQREMYW